MYLAKTLLVTGGAGFIGSHFIEEMLTSESVNVINLDKLTYAANPIRLKQFTQYANYTFIEGDINDRQLVDQLLRYHQVDTVIHFAAESHVDRSIDNPQPFLETNVNGTYVLLEAARHYWLREKKLTAEQCRFHHVSTDEVYGSLALEAPSATEESVYQPNSPYAASKASSDHWVRAYHKTFGLPVTISHCTNNYGDYQHAEKLIPTIIRCALKKQAIPIYGQGQAIRDWLYVKDHISALQLILFQGRVGETYNIAGQNELNTQQMATQVCQLLDKESPWQQSYTTLLQSVTDREGHDLRYSLAINKIKQELDWEPKMDLRQGLQHTIDHYLRLHR